GPATNAGQGGRLIHASNTSTFGGTAIGQAYFANYGGVSRDNPYVNGTNYTPFIPNLLNGFTRVSEAFGIADFTAEDFGVSPASNQGLAVVRLATGAHGMGDAFPGYSYLYIINASSELDTPYSLVNAKLGVNTSETVALLNGGWVQYSTFGGPDAFSPVTD